jgi:hypothetical protein
MSMTRAQLEEQIRGFQAGGQVDPFQGYLTPAPPAVGTPNPSPFRGSLTPSTMPAAPATETDDEEFLRQLMALQQALQQVLRCQILKSGLVSIRRNLET